MTLLSKVFLASLPAYLHAYSNTRRAGGQGLPYALLSTWKPITLALETSLQCAWAATNPPLPSLVEAFCELARNLLCVAAAEIKAVDESLLAPLMEALPVEEVGSNGSAPGGGSAASSGASLRAVARVLGLAGAPTRGRNEGEVAPEVGAPLPTPTVTQELQLGEGEGEGGVGLEVEVEVEAAHPPIQALPME